MICGSPNDAFCSQIAFFRLCLDALGGIYKDARLVAVFGDDVCQSLPGRWQDHFLNIEVKWVPRNDFLEFSYNAQHYARFKYIREDADFATICDADVALFGPFGELLDQLSKAPALAGSIAHFGPWQDPELSKPCDWDILSTAVLGKKIDKPHKYTLMESDESAETPFYINYGVLIGTPELLNEFYEREKRLRSKVISETNSWWGAQLSLALTCVDAGLPTRALPMRYNFPNDPTADRMYPDEMENIVFMHYLRTDVFDRHKIFTSKEEFDNFVKLELKGSNKVMQREVLNITQGKYPF